MALRDDPVTGPFVSSGDDGGAREVGDDEDPRDPGDVGEGFAGGCWVITTTSVVGGRVVTTTRVVGAFPVVITTVCVCVCCG